MFTLFTVIKNKEIRGSMNSVNSPVVKTDYKRQDRYDEKVL
jgi:hypothetical protein